MGALPAWWLRDNAISWTLAPIGWAFAAAVSCRRLAYRRGWLGSQRLPVPVIVVGNIFVGGTGKTPLVVSLVASLRHRGFKPGVVCRGYGGRSNDWPRDVDATSSPGEVGDEPVLIARRARVPVVAGPDRVEAARRLLANTDCDVVVSDDGLQHYRLQRDAEIVVMDGARGVGNGRCLPAGPLREPSRRLASADLVLVNGPSDDMTLGFHLTGEGLAAVDGSGSVRAVADFTGAIVHAVAAIGNPERFFGSLEEQGIQVIRHTWPDHYAFQPDDLDFNDDLPVIMTEKDAVKCAAFAKDNTWYLPVSAQMNRSAGIALDALMDRLGPIRGQA